MPTSTEIPIATTTLASDTVSYTFSSISGSYTDLVLVCSTKAASGHSGNDVRIDLRFNSDTGSNYSDTYLRGNGTSASSGRDSNRTQIDEVSSIPPNSSSEYALFTYNIMNYSNSTTYKTVLCRGGMTGTFAGGYNNVGAQVGLWRSTSAITSITIFAQGGNSGVGFASGSTFTLYGIN